MTSLIPNALLLTAGLGTRLRPLTDSRAKPSLPVAGQPLVERIIRWLASHDVNDLVLNLHYRPESIARIVGDGAHLGVQARYSWEQPIVLGSAGGPALAAPVIGGSPFLVVNGDTLTDVDLSALTTAHRSSGALVTLALVPNRAPQQYGGVRLDETGRIVGFAKRGAEALGSYHFIGVQVVEREAFSAVVPGTPASSIGGVYDHLLTTRPGRLHGFVSDAQFWDIGTPTDYWRTSLALAGGADPIHRGAGVDLPASATIRRSILWDAVAVGEGATLTDCIVTDGVRVPARAVYRGVILSAGRGGELRTLPFDPVPPSWSNRV